MGQIRHGSVTTTHAVQAALQRSQASLATLSREFGINPKTIAKWRKRQTVANDRIPVYALLIYGKNEQDDLTPDQKKAIASMAERIKSSDQGGT